MMTPMLTRRARVRCLRIGLGFCLVFVSCSMQSKIPIVVDDRVEEILRSEATRIMTVSEDRKNSSKYRFLLAEFPRKDILGISVGNRQIYISYYLASLAVTDSRYLWLLRQTVAHEIAHETAGHAEHDGVTRFNRGAFAVGVSAGDVGLPWYVRFYNYSAENELEADLKGLGYWNKLGWDCQIWVRILEDFEQQGYRGDVFHPTDRRLEQAQNVCEFQRQEKPPARNAPRVMNQNPRAVN
jgi:predicted Zn-dependent protease